MQGLGDVEIIVFGDANLFAGGAVIRRAASSLCVEPSRALRAGIGTQLAVREQERGTWLHGEVVGHEEGRLLVRLDDEVARAAPPFPTAFGPVGVRWLALPPEAGDGVLQRWLADGSAPADLQSWRSAEHYVFFSPAGLRIDSSAPPRRGDTVLLSVEVTGTTRSWRAVARVSRVGRVRPPRADHGPPRRPSRRATLHFVHIPDGAVEDLMALARSIDAVFG
jgi:hypothetical protein